MRLLLRPAGFILSTSGFLILGSCAAWANGNGSIMVPVALVATTLLVWYLVQEVLGIYLRPLPGFLGG